MLSTYLKNRGEGLFSGNKPSPSSEAADAPLDCYDSQGPKSLSRKKEPEQTCRFKSGRSLKSCSEDI